MYAIMVTGGKQYKVEPELIVRVEKLDAKVGDKVKFELFMINDGGSITVGSPIKGSFAEGEILKEGKAKKILVYKYKCKKNERKRQGHRQPYSQVKILSIVK